MKKLLLVIIALAAVLCFTACETDDTGQIGDKTEKLDGSLEEIMEKIYETVDVDENFGVC